MWYVCTVHKTKSIQYKHTDFHTSDDVGASTRWRVWVGDLALIAVLTGALAAVPLSLGAGVASVVDWVWPAYEYLIPACGVVAGLFVALAVATGFGRRAEQLDDHVRLSLLAAVVVGALLIAMLSAAVVVATIFEPHRLPQAFVLVSVAWVTLLVSHVIFGVTSLRLRSANATERWERARERAATFGITSPLVVDRDARIRAEVLFWILPVTGWVGVGWLILWGSGIPWSSTYLIVAMLAYVHLLLLIAWRSGADVSVPPTTSIVFRAIAVPIALLTAATFGLSLVSRGLWLLGATYLAYTVALAVLALTRRAARGIPVMRTIQAGSTAASLRRARLQHEELAEQLRRKEEARRKARGNWWQRLRRRLALDAGGATC